jgi:Tol biopolymer transport system component
MDDLRTLVRDEMAQAGSPSYSFNDLGRRRDRKRRNQRIAAGVVGIAVFVAAMWVVMSGGQFDRTQTPVGQGPTGGPKVSNPTPKSAVGPVPETDYLLDLNTGEPTPLPEGIRGKEYAASPDGSRLAFTAPGDNGEGQIFVGNLDGTGIEQVTHDPGAADSPAWSPDGSKIAYIGDHRYLRELFVLDLATGESTQLTFATHAPDPVAPEYGPWMAEGPPSFTPDGSSILYSTFREKTDNVNVSEAEIRIVPVAGGESVRLREGIAEPYFLSPDGSLLSYGCGELVSICVANADGTNERDVGQSQGDSLNGGNWSPDGTRIVYYAFHAQDVFVADATTGQVMYVTEGGWTTWLNDHTLIVETVDRCYNPTTGERAAPGEMPGCNKG